MAPLQGLHFSVGRRVSLNLEGAEQAALLTWLHTLEGFFQLSPAASFIDPNHKLTPIPCNGYDAAQKPPNLTQTWREKELEHGVK